MRLTALLLALAGPRAAAAPAAPQAACPQISTATAASGFVGPIDCPAAAAAAKTAGKRSKLGGVTAKDLARTDARSAAAVKGLQDRLQAAAGDGSSGITPAMADDVRATLQQSQGGLSPEMKALLDAVQADGGKLTPETMKRLQGAGKDAKAAGLDLNIDPAVEKQLLERDLDKDKAEAAEPPPAGM